MNLHLLRAAAAILFLLALPHPSEAQSRAVRRQAVAPAAPSWTGFYGGINLGYGIAGMSDNLPLAGTTMMSGVIGGVQVGYNHQSGSVVLGAEADIQASDQNATSSIGLPIVGTVSVGHRIPYFGTVRGRIGYAFTCGCVMAYATAGAAYGAYEPFASVGAFSISRTYTNVAVTGGAGVEWKVAEGWSTKLEALYFDTGNIGSGVTLPLVGTINARIRSTVTRLGLNYRF